MNAFEIVVIVVCVVALLLAVAAYFGNGGALGQLGRRGRTWFDHRDDIAPSEQPNEDDRDAPIPKRPLRGRPE